MILFTTMGALMTETPPKASSKSIASKPTRPEHHPQYTDIEDASPMHLRQARLHACGAVQADIARMTGVSQQAVSLVLANPCIADYIERQKYDRDMNYMEVLRDFENLLPLAVQRLGDVLRDNDASPRELLKAAEMVFDRETSGSFVKKTKHEKTIRRVVDTTAVQTAKNMAHNLGRPQGVIMIEATEANKQGDEPMEELTTRQWLLGFVEWLMSREEKTSISGEINRDDIEAKVCRFADANGLAELPGDIARGFLNIVAFPDGARAQSQQMPPIDPDTVEEGGEREGGEVADAVAAMTEPVRPAPEENPTEETEVDSSEDSDSESSEQPSMQAQDGTNPAGEGTDTAA